MNLDLIGSDFDDSQNNLSTYSLPNKTFEETLLNKSHHSNSDLNNSESTQNISLMDGKGSETNIQVCFLIEYKKKKISI